MLCNQVVLKWAAGEAPVGATGLRFVTEATLTEVPEPSKSAGSHRQAAYAADEL